MSCFVMIFWCNKWIFVLRFLMKLILGLIMLYLFFVLLYNCFFKIVFLVWIKVYWLGFELFFKCIKIYLFNNFLWILLIEGEVIMFLIEMILYKLEMFWIWFDFFFRGVKMNCLIISVFMIDL